ncbi:hypothetical protein [Nocardia carnea]|uniref:hypothetical protein n=1 Tax=Nocardia carnea TaxID=37328 RepID=UPI00245728A9|nr:hypothetical protein [Nocardia carnea]
MTMGDLAEAIHSIGEFPWPELPDTPAQTCLAPGCTDPVRARGMCRRHYDAWHRRQRFEPAYRSYGRRGCDEPGCDNPHRARGFCSPHYMQHYKAGEFSTSPEHHPQSSMRRGGCVL